MARSVAMFHQRERMQDAVRDLTEHGIVREHILVAPAPTTREPGRPRSILGLPHRVHYAGIGAALGMLAGVAFGGAPGGAATTTMWFVVVGAIFGAFAGGLLGLFVGGVRRQKWRDEHGTQDWMVRVEAPSAEEAERAAQLLQSHGGELLPHA